MMSAVQEIGKATRRAIESVADEIRKRNPHMPWSEALRQATNDPRVSELHRQEKVAKGLA